MTIEELQELLEEFHTEDEDYIDLPIQEGDTVLGAIGDPAD